MKNLLTVLRHSIIVTVMKVKHLSVRLEKTDAIMLRFIQEQTGFKSSLIIRALIRNYGQMFASLNSRSKKKLTETFVIHDVTRR